MTVLAVVDLIGKTAQDLVVTDCITSARQQQQEQLLE